jgi:hypothetical protein
MVTANIDIFSMSYEEPIAYFKRLENHAPLPVD